MDKTRSIIDSMLKENTGISMLDSGGASGRSWQQNQGKDFEKTPYQIVEVGVNRDDTLSLIVSKSTYHFLNEVLTYDPIMDEAFREFSESRENSYWLQDMETFPEYLEKLGYTVTGLYGDGGPMTGNSYNYENAIDQVLQYTAFEIRDFMGTDDQGEYLDRVFSDGSYIILQVHGGCDVRGGYTAPRVFTGEIDSFLIGMSDTFISCANCGTQWFSDDGYHYYEDGSTGGNTLDGDTDAIDLDSYDQGDLDLTDEFSQMITYVLFWQNEDGTINLDRVRDWYPEISDYAIVTHGMLICPDCGNFVY